MMCMIYSKQDMFPWFHLSVYRYFGDYLLVDPIYLPP